MKKVIIQKEWYSQPVCSMATDKLYVFGDNLQEVGRGGQAIIRYIPNSIGLPTKRSPGMNETDFFNDKEKDFEDFNKSYTRFLEKVSNFQGDCIVFPKDGLGTGLAKMDTKSPKLFKHMCEKLKSDFNIILTSDGFI